MKDNMKTYRQELHRIPEISLQEFKTSAYLKKKLQSFGYQTFSLLETDVLVFIDVNSDETIAFRSDIDALPVQEENEIPFKSTRDGYMHACGHDGHMAMLLGLAEYLKDKQHLLQKNILLIFQPAEESTGGAKLLCEKGLLKDYKVQAIFGIHLYPDLPEGTLGSRNGEFMARVSEVNIEVFGKSAHGAMPEQGIDSNLILSKLLIDFQSIQTRNISPLEYSIITFGKMHGGSVRNAISDFARMEGTVRAFSNETFMKIIESMERLCHYYEKAYECKINFLRTEGYLSVINDNALYKRFTKATSNYPLHEFDKPLMIAEDFSFYQDEVPGVFYFVGTKNDKLGYVHSLHHPHFNFDEGVLQTGLSTSISILHEMDVIK